MKKVITIILLAFTLAITAFGFAACNGESGGAMPEPNKENFQYQKIAGKDEYRVIGLGTVSDLDIVIPSTYRGLPVTEIGAYAFAGEEGTAGGYYLTSVTIPNSVTTIGVAAFEECYSLKSVIIPNSVTSIEDAAFEYCYLLTGLTIPNSVTSIGDSAFSYCYSLTNITIPNSVKTIGDEAFYNCYKLVEVINKSTLNIAKDSEDHGEVGYYALNVKTSGESDIVNQGGYLFYTYGDVNYLLGYVGSETNLTLPENYNGGSYEIYKYAFSGCSSLTSVTIPNSVTGIGDHAFEDCYSLTSVTVPNSVTSIESYTFSYCKSLTNVTIPNSVTSIGEYAFYRCRSLTSITIPSSVTSIEDSALWDCNSLTSVTFENPNGWYVSNNADATSGTNLTLTNASQNAEYFKSIYSYYYWKRK